MSMPKRYKREKTDMNCRQGLRVAMKFKRYTELKTVDKSSSMDSADNQEREEVHFIDDSSGLPAELNQLKTAELLDVVCGPLSTMLNYNTEEQYHIDPLQPDGMVGNYTPHHLDLVHLQPSAPEGLSPPMPAPPLPTGAHPCIQNFEGEFGFNICHDALDAVGTSNSWAYSELLEQVFIKMNNVLMVQFKTKKLLNSERFFIRALLVYQNNDYINQAVSRCSIHWIEDDPFQRAHRTLTYCDCNSFNLVGHVLRCQTEGAQYQFDGNSNRHSVIVPLPHTPQAGTDYITVHYFFCCKTSCSRGMQRRAVQIIFTLEDERSQVYGRKVLPVKICSCPKRDKDRQEKDSRTEGSLLRGIKRPLQSISEDVKPTKIENDAALHNLQHSHSTRESLETALLELLVKQNKDVEQLRQQTADAQRVVTAIDSRQKEIQEMVNQLASFKAPQF